MLENSNNYSLEDSERFVSDEIHQSNRSAFERDRARILHSSALRRLGTKTQVLVAGYDDFARTRLTHTLEVGQVGRDLAKGLGCDPDVVESACLAHDLGHPPFGHNGESALDEIAKNIGGFEGNAQTLRILTRLEPKIYSHETKRSAGLNLTRATLDATVKYPWSKKMAENHPTGDRTTKFNVYPDDLPVFEWIRKNTPKDKHFSKCIEAQVMDLADDISYSVHDTEDAIVSSRVQLEVLKSKENRKEIYTVLKDWYKTGVDEGEIDDAFNRLEALQMHNESFFDVHFDGTRRSYAALKNITSTLIGRFCNSVLEATFEKYGLKLADKKNLTRYSADLVVPRKTKSEILALKGFATAFVMVPKEHEKSHNQERQIIFDLASRFENGEGLDDMYKWDFENAESEAGRLRAVVDQIATLTDRSAKETAQSLVGII
ncbi:MAG: deoxyguanosinetriphosphate triphosphohydrolase [Candidatus Ancillula sp.]|jgi:dGTPase|nr:deoxyguanosinetriphosphate triphosphohydrolase [Candidatus Ancillula sp.]